jgi:dUTP pyrophosphatase
MAMDELKLLVKRLSASATLPKRGSKSAAGYDLASAKAVVVPAHGKAICPTDLSIACPPGTYGRIAARSGLAWTHHIDIGAGVIDTDFRGNVGVILFNHSESDLKVEIGDRIAQIIFEKITTPDVVEVEELDETDRGKSGFGSTGVGDSKRVKTQDRPE